MATLIPQALEFVSPSPTATFISPSPIIQLYNFTGVTVTATPEYPFQVCKEHQNADMVLVGPAWAIPFPPTPPFSQSSHNVSESQTTLEKKMKTKQLQLLTPITRDSNFTTVMIKNVPNKICRRLLMEWLDDHCRKENQTQSPENNSLSAFDFLYLPIDFKTNLNKGYAFVNFTNANGAWRLDQAWNNTSWPGYASNKICEIVYASVQGKQALKKRFRYSRFSCNKEDYLPICFNPPRDGFCQKIQQTTLGRVAATSYKWKVKR